VVNGRKSGSTEWSQHVSEVAASTGLSGRAVSRQWVVALAELMS